MFPPDLEAVSCGGFIPRPRASRQVTPVTCALWRRASARIRRRDPMADLAKTVLGRTGLEVTKLGYGAMELRGPEGGRGREVDPADAARILNAVLDSGINFIDTSPD